MRLNTYFDYLLGSGKFNSGIENLLIKIIIGIIGVSIALIAGIMNLYKFHENWVSYRTTAEILKHEKYLFLTGALLIQVNPLLLEVQ